MTNAIGNEKGLQVVEYQNQRVLTTQQLAEVYEASPKNINDNFTNHKDRFIEGKHYYFLHGETLRNFKSDHPDNIGVVANRASHIYLWTEKGASRHCKILDTDQAWKQFDILEETYFKVKASHQYYIPETYSAALLLASELCASLEIAKSENQILTSENEVLTSQLEEAEPKIIFTDSVIASETSIPVGDLAKILRQNGIEMGQNRLYKWMRENGYLMKYGDSRNLPTQKYMEKELFEIKESTFIEKNGNFHIKRTTKVTGKGQVYFINKFKGKSA
jgi:phage antirepressor YoqD-like protein/YHS domain-containing protein